MSRLRRVANYEPVYNAFKDEAIFTEFKRQLNFITEDVLDNIIGDESVDKVVEEIVDKATDSDKIYSLIEDYISDKKVSEEQLPDEQEIVDIIAEKADEEVDRQKIEEAIQEMQYINGDDGIEREYWNSRF